MKVQEQQKILIKQYTEGNPVITIGQIISKLQEDCGLRLSQSAIFRTINKLNINKKLCSLFYIGCNIPGRNGIKPLYEGVEAVLKENHMRVLLLLILAGEI
ncbi:hypothetical protein RF11_09708 [Thelohanellus kitauei]|uniref:Uncharacterized protein n=1 Tax=Thelohanellus kitauei TaxID=669202 RepID=A0A0C2N229_THEKT|nr:hypothetical protein RF11_09708 [Thelohanellus kitauei]